jgi:hypothetical protein
MKISRLWIVAGALALTLSACGGQKAPVVTQTSLKELLDAGTPQTCAVTFENENGQVKGTVVVAAGKARGDFTSTVQGKESHSHLIVLDATAYLWLDGMFNGIKVSTAQYAAAVKSGAPDMNTKVPATCVTWTADDSQFVPPSAVTFRQISVR